MNSDKHVIVPLGGMMTPDEYRVRLKVLRGARAIKLHPAFIIGMSRQHDFDVVSETRKEGLGIFIDEKIFEIPSEAARIAAWYAEMEVNILTVHIAGGFEMMRAVKEAAPNMTILGVTVLTTMDEDDCQRSFCRNIETTVIDFDHDAKEAGIDGTVSAPKDLLVMQNYGVGLSSMIRLVPGVRFKNRQVADDDQNPERTMDPFDIGRLCGDSALMVLGRPIYGADDPAAALAEAERLFREGVAARDT